MRSVRQQPTGRLPEPVIEHSHSEFASITRPDFVVAF
jgi:hypothetical protein